MHALAPTFLYETACAGHTSPQEYHYHATNEQCLVQSGVVAKPWMNAAPDANTASPILAWAADGFPIYGSRECADAGCTSIVVMLSRAPRLETRSRLPPGVSAMSAARTGPSA